VCREIALDLLQGTLEFKMKPIFRRVMARALPLLLLSSGCVHVNEALNAEINAAVTGNTANQISDGVFPLVRSTWKVGQWSKSAVRMGDIWSYSTVKVVGKEGDHFWLETEIHDAQRSDSENPQVMKMLIKGYDAARPESVLSLEIGAVIHQSGQADPVLLPPFVGPMAAGPFMSMMSMDFSNGAADTVVVPAGTFNNATKVHTTTKIGPLKFTGDYWVHSEVPIWGIVKSFSDDGDSEAVLLSFGETGAKSVITKSVIGMPAGN
jgi:hypothetical protein